MWATLEVDTRGILYLLQTCQQVGVKLAAHHGGLIAVVVMSAAIIFLLGFIVCLAPWCFDRVLATLFTRRSFSQLQIYRRRRRSPKFQSRGLIDALTSVSLDEEEEEEVSWAVVFFVKWNLSADVDFM